jgi:hypothetical protein
MRDAEDGTRRTRVRTHLREYQVAERYVDCIWVDGGPGTPHQQLRGAGHMSICKPRPVLGKTPRFIVISR